METQTQTTDILELMRKIETAKFVVLKVQKTIYNALRSFAESSQKPEYEFNRPEIITSDTIIFKKCKGIWCWQVEVEYIPENLLIRHAKLTIFIRNVPELELVLDMFSTEPLFLVYRERRIRLKDGQFEPSEDVPYWLPVPFHSIREKLYHYVERAREYLPPTALTLPL